ncbi:MAG: ssl1498 family light-harvesting-like protein [Cyanobacteria bacterium P01_G01_bin.4]
MYRVDETGDMNNYADEPKAYLAHYPSFYEQQNYLRQGAAATFLITLLLFVAWGVS